MNTNWSQGAVRKPNPNTMLKDKKTTHLEEYTSASGDSFLSKELRRDNSDACQMWYVMENHSQ